MRCKIYANYFSFAISSFPSLSQKNLAPPTLDNPRRAFLFKHSWRFVETCYFSFLFSFNENKIYFFLTFHLFLQKCFCLYCDTLFFCTFVYVCVCARTHARARICAEYMNYVEKVTSKSCFSNLSYLYTWLSFSNVLHLLPISVSYLVIIANNFDSVINLYSMRL